MRFALLAFLLAVTAQTIPSEIHLAITGNSGEMRVSWVTSDSTATSIVNYGLSSSQLTLSASGSASHYEILLYTSPALHSAVMTGLEAGTQYFYQVGDANGGWSSVNSFTTPSSSPPTPEDPFNIIVIADQGATSYSQEVIDAILKADATDQFQLLLLSGDLSYANGFVIITHF
jgi:phosphodiesterase/alkaline phosphatase D-like protein